MTIDDNNTMNVSRQRLLRYMSTYFMYKIHMSDIVEFNAEISFLATFGGTAKNCSKQLRVRKQHHKLICQQTPREYYCLINCHSNHTKSTETTINPSNVSRLPQICLAVMLLLSFLMVQRVSCQQSASIATVNTFKPNIHRNINTRTSLEPSFSSQQYRKQLQQQQLLQNIPNVSNKNYINKIIAKFNYNHSIVIHRDFNTNNSHTYKHITKYINESLYNEYFYNNSQILSIDKGSGEKNSIEGKKTAALYTTHYKQSLIANKTLNLKSNLDLIKKLENIYWYFENRMPPLAVENVRHNVGTKIEYSVVKNVHNSINADMNVQNRATNFKDNHKLLKLVMEGLGLQRLPNMRKTRY